MSQAKTKVSNIEITDLAPRVKDPSLAHLLPATLFPKRMEFEVEGVPNAIARGLSRTLTGELLATAMWFEYEHYSTDNPFAINSMILNRIRLIPIDQKTPIDAVFELDVQNKTDKPAYIYSRDFRIINAGSKNVEGDKAQPLKKLPFNETFPLFTLEPGRWLKITKITVRQDYGYRFAGHCLSCNNVSIPMDQKPLNLYLPEDHPDRGIPASKSNPRHFKIKFNTTGAMEPKEMVVAACDSLIARIQAIEGLLYSIESSDDMYVLKYEGESDTIGNVLMRTVLDLFPDIKAVTYNVDSVARRVTIRIRCDDDINSIFTTVIKHAIRQYTEIKKAFA